MTREDVLKLFPDATDEQITNLLNQNNSEVAREKNKAGKDKEELARLKEVEKEYNEFKEQGMSENEKTVKALETANQKIAELEKRGCKLEGLIEINSRFDDWKSCFEGETRKERIPAFKISLS